MRSRLEELQRPTSWWVHVRVRDVSDGEAGHVGRGHGEAWEPGGWFGVRSFGDWARRGGVCCCRGRRQRKEGEVILPLEPCTWQKTVSRSKFLQTNGLNQREEERTLTLLRDVLVWRIVRGVQPVHGSASWAPTLWGQREAVLHQLFSRTLLLVRTKWSNKSWLRAEKIHFEHVKTDLLKGFLILRTGSLFILECNFSV